MKGRGREPIEREMRVQLEAGALTPAPSVNGRDWGKMASGWLWAAERAINPQTEPKNRLGRNTIQEELMNAK